VSYNLTYDSKIISFATTEPMKMEQIYTNKGNLLDTSIAEAILNIKSKLPKFQVLRVY
jgi:hypothetical protein